MLKNQRLGVLLAALVFALLLFWGLAQREARREAETQLANRYQQAFFDAIAHVENVEVLLAKGLASSAPEQIARIFADLSREATAAQASLTQLPLQQGTLMRTGQFLTQVGDFAYSMTLKAAAGNPPDSAASDLMRRMQSEAALLSAALHQIQQEAADGPMPWRDVQRGARVVLRRESKEVVDESGFARLENHFQQIPQIQYDGPFSDHVLQRQPKGLTGPRVSEARAQEIALRFLEASGREGYRAEAVRRIEGGDIPGYGIAVSRPGARAAEIVLDVSEKGGHVVWMLDKRTVASARIGAEEAVERARRFLEAHGFEDMVPTYASEADNRIVIPFVPEVDGVRIYPDLIKVTVALDDGTIVGYDALGYLMSHHERKLPEPKVTAAQARELVGAQLQVTAEPRLALIPLPTLEEVLTWEVAASLGQERFLVYIDVETGAERQVLRLVQTNEGDLTL